MQIHPMYLRQIPYGGAYKGGGLFGKLFGRKKVDEQGNVHRSGLRGMFHGLHGVEKAVRPIVKTALPIMGTIAGNMFGGPMGAMIGGGMGGALSSKSHKLDHALFGAALGGAGSFLLPKIGGMFGVNPQSGMGSVLGMQAPSMGSLFGWGNGKTGYAAGDETEGMGELSGEGGMMPGSLGGRNGKSNGFFGGINAKDLLDAALLGTAVVGTIGRKEKAPKEESMAEMMQRNKPVWGPEDQPRRVKPINRRYVAPPEGYRPGIDPEHMYFEDVNPPTEYYAEGGYVDGDSGGQEDDVEVLLPEDSFVENATIVSLLGDGNTENGKKKINAWEQQLLRSGKYQPQAPRKMMRARLSPGEYVISPEAVEALGKGNNKKGAQTLYKMDKKLLKHKGVKSKLPPKSKPITQYTR